jgi:hypothetical protein
MKLDQLRKVIREEVKAAVKEELQDMLNEAVRVASQPQVQQVTKQQSKPVEVQKPTPTSTDPIMEMLNQTKASMTSAEYKSVYTGTSDMVQKPNFASMMASNMGMTEQKGPMPGLDISQFDFVKKAGQVYKKSVEKDKQKYGVV